MLVERKVDQSTDDALIGIKDLYVHFKANYTSGNVNLPTAKVVRAVDGINLKIDRGEILSLVGESGSGKTTLGRTIVGLAKPTSGQIVVDGKAVDFRKRDALRKLWKSTQMIFQDPYSSFNPLSTIYDALRVPVKKFKLANTEQETRKLIEKALVDVGLEFEDTAKKYPNQLSGGQRQRASIARALIVQPEIIVADEPVSMLDVSLRAGILELLTKLNEKNHLTLVFITHDLAVAQYISNRIAVMYKGKIVEIAEAKEVIQSPAHPYTELLLRSAPRLRGEQGWSEKQELVFRTVEEATFKGCSFYPRCPLGIEKCVSQEPRLVEIKKEHKVACYVRAASTEPENKI
jgi:peptide/nickel transport system ATP-binding protein